jgi:glutamine synthetase
MLAAGYEGIKKGYPLPDPVEENIFEMDAKALKRHKIDTLPGSLMEALNLFKKSDLLKEVLGDHIFETLVNNKTVEWDNFRVAVTDFEINNYLKAL